MVDLDAEKGRQPRQGQAPDQVKVIIRPSKVVRMAVIEAYLNKSMPWDNSILEAISKLHSIKVLILILTSSLDFLDHAMRMWPSDQFTSVKRSFFVRGEQRTALDNVIEAMRGVYTSIRLCNPKSSIGGVSTGLALNVDVANGTFWTVQDVHQAARNLCKDRNRNLDYKIFAQQLLPVKMRGGGITMSEDFKNLRKMHKLKFHVKHRGKEDGKYSKISHLFLY